MTHMTGGNSSHYQCYYFWLLFGLDFTYLFLSGQACPFSPIQVIIREFLTAYFLKRLMHGRPITPRSFAYCWISFVSCSHKFFWGDETFKVAVLQLALSGLLSLFVFTYLYRSLEYFHAFLAALLMVVDPLSILLSLMILSETLFTFILFIAFVFIAHWAATQQRSYLMAAGVFLGAACLVRPIGQLMVVIWLGMILLYPDRTHPFFFGGGLQG